MEINQLYQGLTFLSYSTGVIVLLVGVMLIKVLFDFGKLVKNVNETTTIIKTEIEPTLKNINKSVGIVSSIIIKVDNTRESIKKFISKTPFKLLANVSKMTGTLTKGFISGIITAFKACSKK